MSTTTSDGRRARGPAAAFGAGVRAVSRVCGVISAAMIVAAVLITCQLIFMRFVLNASTIWQTEAVTYLVIGATLIGLPYVQQLRGHVNVDLLPIMLPPKARRVLAALTAALTLAVILIMLYHGYELFMFAWDRGWRSDSVWGVKLWIPYIAMPLGFGLYALQLVADIVAPDVSGEVPLAEPALAPVVDGTQERPDAGEKAALGAGEGRG